jgi:hypothetical protein
MFDSLGLELSLDTALVGVAVPSDAGVTVSSPDETTVFERKDPLSLLKREPSFDVLLLFSFVSGRASRLFDVETSFGIEISLGSTRLRIDVEYDRLSGRLTDDDDVLFNAIIAASAFF